MPPSGFVGHAWRDDPVERYDPGAHTVAEVTAYVADHPEERAAVLAAEEQGRARVTLLAQLR